MNFINLLIGSLLLAASSMAAIGNQAVGSPSSDARSRSERASIDLFTQPQPEVVDPADAFRVDAIGLGTEALAVRFSIADCCYLYRAKMRFGISGPEGAPLADGPYLGRVELPRGVEIADEFFGRSEIYRGSVDVRLPLHGATAEQVFALKVTYQGCAEKGAAICYEPMTRRFPIRIDSGELVIGPPRLVPTRAETVSSETEAVTGRLLVLALAAAGAFGALLALGGVVHWRRRRQGSAKGREA